MFKGSPCQLAANKQRRDIKVKMGDYKVKVEGWAGRHRERGQQWLCKISGHRGHPVTTE
jgi:hypothetical protein